MWANIMAEEVSVGAQAPTTGGTVATSQVEEKPVSTEATTTEKSTKPVVEGDSVEGVKAPEANLKSEAQTVPLDRFSEVITERNSYKEKAQLLDQLQANPELASAFLRNVQVQEVDPVVAEADSKLKEMGYVKLSEVEKLVDERVQNFVSIKDFQKDFIQKVRDLEGKYDGKNGAPKFVGEEVAKFMDDNGIKDAEIAYEVMNKEALADWRASSKTGTTFTEKPGSPVRQSSDTRKADLEEASRTGNYTEFLKKYISIPGK